MSEDRTELELKYSWDWFSYHAGQRLTAFNFFLVLMGAVVVGYTQAVSHQLQVFGIALGALGAFVAFAFLVMDVRNEELVAYGREALEEVEARLVIKIRGADKERKHLDDAIRGAMGAMLLAKFDEKKIAHRIWLRRVIGVMGLLSAAGFVWAALDYPGTAAETEKTVEQTIICHEAKAAACWPAPPMQH